MSDYANVKAAFDAVAEKYGRIDILVNNAGISENTPFVNYTEEVFDRVMGLNISSMVSRYGQPAGIAYPTSKFAVNGFMLSLARELAPKGVRMNAVAPALPRRIWSKPCPRRSLTR